MAGQRLVKKIFDEYEIPILIGGYALQTNKIPKFAGKVIPDMELEKIPKILRSK